MKEDFMHNKLKKYKIIRNIFRRISNFNRKKKEYCNDFYNDNIYKCEYLIKFLYFLNLNINTFKFTVI